MCFAVGDQAVTVVAMDTYEVVRELKAAGFTDAQAEAVTRVVRRAYDFDMSTLPTKTDLELGLATLKGEVDLARAATKADLDLRLASVSKDLEVGLASVRGELEIGLASIRKELEVGLASVKTDLEVGLAAAKTNLAEVKSDILKWLLGSLGFQTVAIIGAVLALVRSVTHG